MNGQDKARPPQSSSRIFGVALDPADDPWSLQLKRAWMTSDHEGLCGTAAHLDPYDALTESMGTAWAGLNIKPGGKFPIPSWLWPKPSASDISKVTAPGMADFFDSGLLLELVRQLQTFVAGRIFPDIPIMIGIDHSATAGVVAALAEKYGPSCISVIVLDQHFDAIPLSVRASQAAFSNSIPMLGLPAAHPSIAARIRDHFCCGNFWAHLMDTGTVVPENLFFIGVADYPEGPAHPQFDDFRKCYMNFEKRGCSFFPRRLFDQPYLEALTRRIQERVTSPYVYVSLDLDVASFNGTYAARYMDRPGIGREQLLAVAHIIASGQREGRYTVAGLDIMEFNTHFLGLQTPEGLEDGTLALAGDFIRVLI